MTKFINSLQTKLTVSFIVLILVVSSLTYLFTFRETKKGLKEITQTELVALSSVIANELSGVQAEEMASLIPGEEPSPKFVALAERLKSIQGSHPDIKYLYTMKKSEKGLSFMVDPEYNNADDPGAKIGEDYEGVTDQMLEAFEKPAVDDEFTTDKWGTLLSGYSPIRDTKGNVVGIVGVDMASDLVMRKQAFIGQTIYIIIAIAILLAALFIFFFSKTIIKDIRKLNNIANDISMGNMGISMDVERKDEIGELAQSFGRMVASLKIMMMNDNDSDK
jgi:HAMP domain-containing protein